jgi:hypothetical protein
MTYISSKKGSKRQEILASNAGGSFFTTFPMCKGIPCQRTTSTSTQKNWGYEKRRAGARRQRSPRMDVEWLCMMSPGSIYMRTLYGAGPMQYKSDFRHIRYLEGIDKT